jgi:hypothetical protein
LLKSNPITSFDLELCEFPLSFLTYLARVCPTLKSLTVQGSSSSSADHWDQDIKEILESQSTPVPRQPCQLDDVRIQGIDSNDMVWRVIEEEGFDLSCLRTFHCQNDHISSSLTSSEYVFIISCCRPPVYLPVRPLHVFQYFCFHSLPKEMENVPAALKNTPVFEVFTYAASPSHLQSTNCEKFDLSNGRGTCFSVFLAHHTCKRSRWGFAHLGQKREVLEVIDEVFVGNFEHLKEVEISTEFMDSGSRWEAIKNSVAGAFPVLRERKLLDIT